MTTETFDLVGIDLNGVAAKYEHVMLVDDDPLQNMFNNKLIQKGCFASRTTTFNSAKEALGFLANASQEELPTVIFLDIIMPEMDGFSFLEAFAKLNPTITDTCKVVMLSSSESFDHLNRANKNRLVRKFLNKPMSPEMLQAINI